VYDGCAPVVFAQDCMPHLPSYYVTACIYVSAFKFFLSLRAINRHPLSNSKKLSNLLFNYICILINKNKNIILFLIQVPDIGTGSFFNLTLPVSNYRDINKTKSYNKNKQKLFSCYYEYISGRRIEITGLRTSYALVDIFLQCGRRTCIQSTINRTITNLKGTNALECNAMKQKFF